MAILEDGFVPGIIPKIAPALDKVLRAIPLGILKLAIGASEASAGVGLELLREPVIDHPNRDSQQQDHACNHRPQHFRAETDLWAGPKFFHVPGFSGLVASRRLCFTTRRTEMTWLCQVVSLLRLAEGKQSLCPRLLAFKRIPRRFLFSLRLIGLTPRKRFGSMGSCSCPVSN